MAGLQGVHRRLREQPAAAGDRPRPGAQAPRLRAAAAEPIVLHALSGWPLPHDGARPRADPPGGGALLRARRRRPAPLRGHARAGGRLHRAHAPDDAARSLVALAPGPPGPGPARPALPPAGPGRAARHRDHDRGGGGPPRPLVRVGPAQGHPGHRRDHRGQGRAVDAGDGLRAVPPRHGRVRRRPGRVGLRPRGHGRDQQRPGRGRPRARRRDPRERGGGAHPREGRPRAGGGPRRRHRDSRGHRRLRLRSPRDLPRAHRRPRSGPPSFSTRCAPSTTRARASRSTSP